MSTLRYIASAQNKFLGAELEVIDGVAQFGTLEQLANNDPPLIDSVTASGTRSGYLFSLEVISGPNPRFEITAVPLKPGRTGIRSFFTDETGVLRSTDEGRATADSRPLN